MVKRKRDYLRVIIECLAFTAQENIAQRGHREYRHDIGAVSDVGRRNFLKLFHMRCKDVPWLEHMLKSQIEHHIQWTSPIIQIEIFQIIADLILERIQNEIGDNKFAIIMDETSDISITEQVCVSEFRLRGCQERSFCWLSVDQRQPMDNHCMKWL